MIIIFYFCEFMFDVEVIPSFKFCMINYERLQLT